MKAESQHRKFVHLRHVSVTPAVRNRKSALSNIWIFDSPKNDKRFIIKGDVAFMHSVLFEGDLSITRYDPDPIPVLNVIDGEQRHTTLDAVVYFSDGCIQWTEFGRSQSTSRPAQPVSLQAAAARASGAQYRLLTDADLVHKKILFDNWLLLCAAITRARNVSMFREAHILHSRLEAHRAITFGSLLQEPESDPGSMFALVAKSLQQGVIRAELDQNIFGMDSVITRSVA